MPDIWGVATILAKWALYIGVLVAVGSAFSALIFKLERWRHTALRFASLGLSASFLSFMLKGTALTGDASGMVDSEMLKLLWDTRSGTTLLYQTLGMSLLLTGLVFGKFAALVSSLGGIIALWSFVTIGHIADRDSLLLTLILALHLITASFWIGILNPLYGFAMKANDLSSAAKLGREFGFVAMIAVPVLLGAGGYMSWVLVGSLNALLTTGYGQTLLLKVVLVALLLVLAALNKLRFVPALEDGDMKASHHLVRSIRFEWAAFLAILMVTATFTSILTLPM